MVCLYGLPGFSGFPEKMTGFSGNPDRFSGNPENQHCLATMLI
jgi:hypothetical protein